MREVEEKKNTYSWRVCIITATMILQLLTAAEYYNMYREFHDQIVMQTATLELQVKVLETVNQSLQQRAGVYPKQ